MESAKTKLVVTYARVSSVGRQKLDRQTEGFAASQKFDRNYTDKISGIVPFADRPNGARLLEDCRNGLISEVHFWELSRLGRDVLDITATLQFFIKVGIQVVIQKEHIRLLDDDGKVDPCASIIVAVMTALSSIERSNILERQMEGIAIAKAKGIYVGRKHGTRESAEKFLQKPKSVNICKLLDERYRVVHIAKVLGVSTTTVIKVKRMREKAGKAA
jgi:DNA invertase Pin-like site-specific DNA recombinase